MPMEVQGESRYRSYSFLTSVLDGGDWLSSLPGRALPLRKEPLGTHWTGGWVTLRLEEKFLACTGDRTSIARCEYVVWCKFIQMRPDGDCKEFKQAAFTQA
jgi:hypothetical protein